MGYPFSQFIGIDWSGSAGYGRGDSGEFPIQVALCDVEGALSLVNPTAKHNPRWRENRWSRTTVLSWLTEMIKGHDPKQVPLLIGLDFAFSFPHLDLGVYLPGHVPPIEDWTSLSALIHGLTGDDFSPDRFIKKELVARHFLVGDVKGDDFKIRHRVCERGENLLGRDAASVFKLVGGDQVGRGAISGIACLEELRREFGHKIQVWPFDGLEPSPDVLAVIVEVFPRYLYELAGVPPNAYDYPKVFRLALRDLGVRAVDESDVALISTPRGEDSADAVITAASLRYHCSSTSLWNAPVHIDGVCHLLEGWIWGAGYEDCIT